MNDFVPREEFDTGIAKIRHEIKSLLVPHGLFGTVTNVDIGPLDQVPTGCTIEIVVKGKSAVRSFDRQQIVDCRLRVRGAVLDGILSMVDELSTTPPH